MGKGLRCAWRGPTAAVFAFLLICADAIGQLQVSARLEHPVALLYEPVVVHLRVRNQTSGPITIGPAGDATLRVYVERRPGYPVSKTETPIEVPETVILPRTMGSLDIDISTAFAFHKTGPYTVHATLVHDGEAYQAGRMLLELIPGFEVARLEVGVPGAGKERREYRLLSVQRNGATELFMRVDDRQNGLCYGVYPLGRALQGADPILEVDAQGRAHVLHRSGPAQYTHTIHEPNGHQAEKTLYIVGAEVARLEAMEDGNFEVRGVQEDESDRSGNRPAIRAFDPFE